ncbi:MAG TPA: GtrA family protein [Sphingomonas sp.]|jgi:putative flippase GtrA|nr:GtrA family protein [Sphingomonas sp.]
MTEMSLRSRLLSRRAAAMLGRNTVVSTAVFLLDMALLWALVQLGGMGKVLAAAIGFVIANTLHYALGRSWIFAGTERGVAEGYAYFLINAGVGLAITLGLYAAFLAWTPINYLVARVIVSVFAGLAVFLLNAVLNFRRL